MALSIKDPMADRLARELAEATRGPSFGEELRAISQRCAALPDLDTRSAEEIIGYDENGVPGAG